MAELKDKGRNGAKLDSFIHSFWIFI